MGYAFVNGKIIREEKAVISIFDRGFVLGDGIFESFRAVKFIPEFFEKHFSRFARSAEKLLIPIPVSAPELSQIVKSILIKNKLKDAVVRVTLTRGAYAGDLSIKQCTPTLVITAKPVKGLSVSLYKNGVDVALSSVKQEMAGGVEPSIKSLNYLANIVAKAEADNAKCYEALLLNRRGNLTELSTSNFFCIINDVVLTPRLSAGILPGVTRDVVLSLLQQGKSPFKQKTIHKSEIKNMQEAFLTSSIRGIVPIRKLGTETIGIGAPGPTTQKIRQLYLKSCSQNRLNFKKKAVNSQKSSQ
ncbi:MAG: aminotransferase class IV [Fibrobacteria bacterium]|nr:aminotransferase class IV [Fibrobacteria bacterium]